MAMIGEEIDYGREQGKEFYRFIYKPYIVLTVWPLIYKHF